MLALPTPNLAQPLDPVEEQLPFLVVHQLIVEAGNRFPENGAADLVTDGSAEYPLGGRRAPPLWSPPRTPNRLAALFSGARLPPR